MPFIPHTPESLLPRSDSKNPATTCRGITISGRPCRRAIPALSLTPLGTFRPQEPVASGTVSLAGEAVKASFCWQHQEQAEELMPKKMSGQMRGLQIAERTSIETLVQRIGVLRLDGNDGDAAKKRRRDDGCAGRESANRVAEARQGHRGRARDSSAQQPCRTLKRPTLWAALCCIGSQPEDDDYFEVVRHTRRTQDGRKPEMSMGASAPVTQREQHAQRNPNLDPIQPAEVAHKGPSPVQTSSLLSPVLDRLPPYTAASILVELFKPISVHDEEGYIYMYWLTPGSPSGAPPPGIVPSLPSPSPGRSARSHQRRPSDVLDLLDARPESGKSTVLLKIGRASNVQRRMSEWSRQCGHSLSLLRWYPHVSTAAFTSPGNSPATHQSHPHLPSSPGAVRKVPHAHRVERLIHLELAEQRVKRVCGVCGKEHREWFEVGASREELRRVDDVVRRWVAWGEDAL